MLVSAKEMMTKALAGKYAVGQFNINNLEWTKAILLTAQELQSPVILGVSEGAGKYMTGFKTVAAMVKAMVEELGITVPVALHLDHGTYEGCYKCVKAGFSSIMFDGSHYPFEENLAKSTELVHVADQLGLSIECVKRTALSVWASAQIQTSARQSLISALQCSQLVSVTFTVSIQQTGQVFHSRHLLLSRKRLAICHWYFTAVQVFLMT